MRVRGDRILVLGVEKYAGDLEMLLWLSLVYHVNVNVRLKGIQDVNQNGRSLVCIDSLEKTLLFVVRICMGTKLIIMFAFACFNYISSNGLVK